MDFLGKYNFTTYILLCTTQALLKELSNLSLRESGI